MAKAVDENSESPQKRRGRSADYIRHMGLGQAKVFLEKGMAKEQAVPYRRHRKEVSHKSWVQGWYAGRYPVKAAKPGTQYPQ